MTPNTATIRIQEIRRFSLMAKVSLLKEGGPWARLWAPLFAAEINKLIEKAEAREARHG